MAPKRKYNWKELQAKLAKGAVYPLGSPFQYKHQLRIKCTPQWLACTYWVDNKCVASQCFQGAEETTWDELLLFLGERRVLQVPCVGVGVSVWNEQSVLLRPESQKGLGLDVVNRALRDKPEDVRKDLLSTGIYGYRGLSWDENKILIVGVPLGYCLKNVSSRFPEGWSISAWPGQVAFPFCRISRRNGDVHPIECHTVLSHNVAVNLLIQDGSLKYLQQDKLLTDLQEITAASVTKFRILFNMFKAQEIHHFLYPVDVNANWVTNLRAYLQGFKWTAETEIVPVEKMQFPNIPPEFPLQDMFPLQEPGALLA